MFTPGGFHRPIAARERKWNTKSGKAHFVIPSALDADPDMRAPGGEVLRLMTLRSNDQRALHPPAWLGLQARCRDASGLVAPFVKTRQAVASQMLTLTAGVWETPPQLI
jgi:hypothetical protein